ncbi:serine/threonine-protein kinase [Streptomyces triculaminicus]|uniref:serine/threonine-protein kinase n=1 Tax=Streptomyces triculaminicus TaxID=2816232 RepID=UPI00340861ED
MDGSSGTGRLLAGRYRLQRQLGHGGMGVVWQARDEVLGREVAVKEVLAPAGMPGPDVRQLYARLEREARAAARVSHRNVVTVHDVVGDDGRPWIVMELVPGVSLADLLEAEGPLDPARAARIGAEVLAALRGAHAVGVLHRDVKPGNVLIGNDGRVVLSDFGIATLEGSSALTATGQLVGSPEYLAPERALGRPPGPESDLWSLGVTLYAAVEGRTPFRQDTPLSTLRAVVDAELPPPRRAGALTPVLAALLRKDPAERPSVPQAENMLRTVAAGGPAPGDRAAAGAAYAPTVAAAPADPAPPARGAGPGPAPGGAGGQGDAPAPRGRRGRTVLVAGVLVAALAAAGLVWGLTRGGGSGAGGSPGGGASAASGDGKAGAASGSASGPGGGSGSSAVNVVVTALRDSYSGPCPPPRSSAPSFQAGIAVDRAPVEVVYRWVTGSGHVSDGGWKTLRFGAGAGLTQLVEHVETGHRSGDPDKDWIAVEVKSPRTASSERVPFSVSCAQAPTGGSSSPAAPSPSGPAPSASASASTSASASKPSGPGLYGGASG